MTDKKEENKNRTKVKVVITRPWAGCNFQVGQLTEIVDSAVSNMRGHLRLATEEEAKTGKVVKPDTSNLKAQVKTLEAANQMANEKIASLEGQLQKANAEVAQLKADAAKA